MTPISFALEILLDCETIEKAHKACRKYIKLLEGRDSKAPRQVVHPGPPPSLAQAPSTQRLLEAHGISQAPLPQVKLPPAQMDKETGRAMVPTGNGTMGPRKF